MTATDELRKKLNKLIIELDRLDIVLDLPASDMTLGEYEQHREELLDRFTQDIAVTLGSGTCELNWILQGKSQTQEFWRCECGNCGECFGVEDRSSFPFKTTINEVEVPNFCPNCGRKVVNA